MGSASRQALGTAIAALDGLGRTDLETAERLLAATRAVAGSHQLRHLLADPGIEPHGKVAVVRRVFSGYGDVVGIIETVATERWSNGDELVDGLETLGFRAVAASAGEVPVERELFSFGQVVRSNAELELAMGSSQGTRESKAQLVDRLLAGASAQTRLVVRHIVLSLGRRRFADSIARAAAAIADQAGLGIATVRTAAALTDEQRDRLVRVLTERYGRRLSLNQIVDPALIGGVRISVGDDVIDGSVATRLNDLRLQLAG